MRRYLSVLLAILMMLFFAANAESGFCIHFIDVGQADAAVVICDDESLMIDGGNVDDSSLIYSYLTNTLNMDHLDSMIATHAHEDHIGGLSAALNACSVGTVYAPVTDYDSDAFRNFYKYAQQNAESYVIPDVGDTFEVGSATVQFLSPARQYEDTNDTSIVVKITYGNTSFLFAGDAEWDPEHDMVESGFDLSSTLLKVGHHGSNTSSSYVFLREIMPQYAVISVGAGNSYGHPSEETLSRLRDVGAKVYRTDLQGNIICYSDGNSLTFVTQKKASDEDIIGEDGTTWEATVSSDQSDDSSPVAAEALYIGNKNSKKLHYADCSSVGSMKESNKVEFESREDAIAQGYEPCKKCNP